MIKARVVGMLAIGLLITGTASVARAADPDPDAWHVGITPYVWAAGIYGDVTVKGQNAEVEASFLDLLEETDTLVGLAGRLEVTKGRFGVFGDVFYVKTEVEDSGTTRLDITTRMWFIDFGGQFRVLDTTDDRVPGLTLDVYGGGRYSYLELDLDTAGAPSLNQSKEWVDPIVGARVGCTFPSTCSCSSPATSAVSASARTSPGRSWDSSGTSGRAARPSGPSSQGTRPSVRTTRAARGPSDSAGTP